MDTQNKSMSWLIKINISVILLCLGQGIVFGTWLVKGWHAHDKILSRHDDWINGHDKLVDREKALLSVEITGKLGAKSDAQYGLLVAELSKLKDEITNLKIAINHGTTK